MVSFHVRTPYHTKSWWFFIYVPFFFLNPGTLSIKQLLGKKICVYVHSHLPGLVACWQFFILYLLLSSHFFSSSAHFVLSFIYNIYFYVSVCVWFGIWSNCFYLVALLFFLAFNFRVNVDLIPCPYNNICNSFKRKKTSKYIN